MELVAGHNTKAKRLNIDIEQRTATELEQETPSDMDPEVDAKTGLDMDREVECKERPPF